MKNLAVCSIFLTLVAIFFVGTVFGQDLSISSNIINLSSNELLLQLKIENKSEQPYLFLKPVPETVCGALFKVKFKSSSQSHEWFPCEGFENISQTKLDDLNTIVLVRGKKYSISYRIEKKQVSPWLTKDDYELIVEINYTNVNMISESEIEVFKGYLKSNELQFELYQP